MGIRLVVEVLDHAPAWLTTQERLLLVVLAETASDQSRTCWPGMEILTRRMGLSPRRVREVLADLAARGYELRVPSGVDKHGMPVFATKGHRSTYRVPSFRQRGTDPAPFKAAEARPLSPPKRAGSGTQRRRKPVEKGAGSRPPFPQEPSEEPSNHPRASYERTAAVIQALRDRTGKTIDPQHAELLIKQLLHGRIGIRDPVAYLTGAIAKDPDPTRFLPTPSPPRYQH